MQPSMRTSRLAYAVGVQRVGDYAFRAAATRLILVAVIAVTVAAAGAHWVAWVAIGLAAFGTYLATSDAYYTEYGGEPREPLARITLRYSSGGLGQNQINPSGVIEALAYLPLGAVGPWLMDPTHSEARLICVAAALGYVASCVCAVFVDPAFYNPDVTMPKFIEGVRSVAGVVTAFGAAVVVLPAEWEPLSRWIAGGLCVSMLGIQLRIRETDRALAAARSFSDNEQIIGRQAITEYLHSMVGAPLGRLNVLVAEHKSDDPELFDGYRSLVGGYREIMALDVAADLDIDWPGLLASNLRALTGVYGTKYRFSHPQNPLHQVDRVLAHLVLDDLATNAGKAAARECTISLTFDPADGHFEAVAVDDGDPVKPGAWMRAGGGLERLNKRLAQQDGGITLAELADRTKRVTARWAATSESDDTK